MGYNKVICFTALYIKIIKESIVDHVKDREFWDIFGRHPAKVLIGWNVEAHSRVEEHMHVLEIEHLLDMFYPQLG